MTLELFDAKPKVRKRRLNVLPQNPESRSEGAACGPGRFPSWLHRSLPKGGQLWDTGRAVAENRLHTVCEEAKCPNLLECWSHKTATFLVFGSSCTRACGFCDIDFTKAPPPLEPDEPARVADATAKLGLKHVVITMVARDDLEDGGAAQLHAIVTEIRKACPSTTIELLTSDFQGREESLQIIADANPDIFNHNVETVERLTPRVRHTATYERSLNVLRTMNLSGKMPIKSGIMVGLGETDAEVEATLADLKEVGCDIVTIGQYLQPNRKKLRVQSFVTPEQFKHYESFGHDLGIPYMYSGPFVRSSYNAGVVIEKAKQKFQIYSQ